MTTVTVNVNDGKVTVDSPFNRSFVEKAKELGGKWSRPVRDVWNFDGRDEARVRQLCMDVYGTDGSPMPTVTMRVNLDEASDMYDELIIGPIQVLRKTSRDVKPKLGDGCIVIEGGLQSYGGSRANPRITFDKGTVIEVRNVPVTIANQLVQDDSDCYSIVDESNGDELSPEEQSLVVALQALSADRLALVLGQVQ